MDVFGLSLQNLILLLVISICAITDILHEKIYNKITYTAIILGVIIGAAGLKTGVISHDVTDSLLGFSIGFIPLFFVSISGGIGGGDVKLLAAIGAIKGAQFVIYSMFYSFLIGGFIALSILIWRGDFLPTMKRILRSIYTLFTPGMSMEPPTSKQTQKVRFGVVICFGTLCVMVLEILNTNFGGLDVFNLH